MSRHTAIIQRSSEAESADTEPAWRVGTADSTSAAYGRLIARLFSGADPLKVVAFTSTSPQEGVTYVVTHVAAEIERMTDRRVAVMSASDLGKKGSDQPAWLLWNNPHTRRADADRVATLRSRYDVVLLDAGSIAEGAIINPSVDGVVVVVEVGRTTKRDLNRSLTAIEASQCRVVGLVLNKYKPVLPSWLERLLP